MHIIYRASDRLICAIVHPPQPVQNEMNAILASARLGGVADDYVVVEVADKLPDEQWTINADGTVTIEPDAAIAELARQHTESRDAAINKFIALGLTSDEIAALLR